MKKEITFAIFAGIMLGLMIAFGVWRANRSLKSATDENSSDPASITQAISDNNGQSTTGLTIVTPEQNDVLTENPVVVKGLTGPNSTVIISGENDDFMITADPSGAFEKEIPLIGGINDIDVMSTDTNGTIANINMTVVYSTEFNK